MKLFSLLFLFIYSFSLLPAQSSHYQKAYLTLEEMLEGKQATDIRHAVFTMENAYCGGILDRTKFDTEITRLGNLCKDLVQRQGFQQYKTAKNWAIFMLMTQPIPHNLNKPYTYDFDDFLGREDYWNVLVNRAMKDKKGNCYSLPLLYLCIAEEIGAEASLALGPNHTWIRHIDEDGKWSNVELTSGQFPSDGLMMTELGIRAEAIKSGAYFEPLGEKEFVAYLMSQLADSYENKHGILDEFTAKCLDTSIEYFPANIVAWMMRTNKVVYDAQVLLDSGREDELPPLLEKFKTLEKKVNELGAQEFDLEEYNKWVDSMKTRKE